MKRKFLAWLMTCAMVFNMALPYAAFADDILVDADSSYATDEFDANDNDESYDVEGEPTVGESSADDEQPVAGGASDEEPAQQEQPVDANNDTEYTEGEAAAEPADEPADEPEVTEPVAGLLQGYATLALGANGLMTAAVATQSTDYNTVTCVNSGEYVYLNTVTISGAKVKANVAGTTDSSYNYSYNVVLAGDTALDAEISLKVANGVDTASIIPQAGPQGVAQADATISFGGTELGSIKNNPTSTVTLADGAATAVYTVSAASGSPYTPANTATHTFNFSVAPEPGVSLGGTPAVGDAYTVTKRNMEGVTGETYQWYRVDGEAEILISGATADTYTPVVDDYGCKLKIEVTLADSSKISATSTETVACADSTLIQESATVTAADSDAGVLIRKQDGTVLAKGVGSATATILRRETYEYMVYKSGYYTTVGEIMTKNGTASENVAALTACDISDSKVWASFRGSADNMAIVSAKTPTDKNAVEKWAYRSKINPVFATPPMLMGDYIVVAYGTSIELVNKSDGKIAASGTMQAGSSYTQHQPAYGDGRIYFAQNEGKMEAFDAKTLKSLWKYTNKVGGQDSSPILYNDGYVYTGYYAGDAGEFVCINAQTGEEVWTQNVHGGFYWSGPVVVGDAIIVGSNEGGIYAWNKLTGAAIVTTINVGERISSTMAYSAAKGRIYFTTNGVGTDLGSISGKAYLCSMAVDPTTGAISDLQKSALATWGDACTTTPVVYGDYVYLSSGNGGSTGYFLVAKADTLEIVNSAKLASHTKTSPLLSTAYLASEGYLYFYVEDYATSTDIELIKVKAADPTKADNISVVPLLTLSQRQYAMNSIGCDDDGTLYLKNDSGYIFAVEGTLAYLSELTADVGTFDKELSNKVTALELVVPVGTQSVNLTMKASDGAAVSVGDTAVTGGKYTATLVDGKATLAIKVTAGSYSRTYNVTIREVSVDTQFHVATTSGTNGNNIKINHVDITAYSDNAYVVTGATTGTRIWYGAKDTKSTVAAPTVLKGTSNYTTQSSTYNDIKYSYRLFGSMTFPLIVKSTVTAENGATKDYYILAIEDETYDGTAYCAELSLDSSKLVLGKGGSTKLTPTVNYIGKNAPDVTWTSDSDSVATVAQDGTVTAVAKGTAVITATAGGMSATCTVDVKDNLTVYMSYSDGAFVLGKDGKTELCNVPVEVAVNADGKYTVADAFKALHKQYCADENGFEVSTSGYIAKFWGVTTSEVSYVLNNSDNGGLLGLTDNIADGDYINAFKYQDTQNWAYSDLYTYFASTTATADVNEEKSFTVNGYNVMNQIVAYPKGAAVKVYGSDGKAVDTLATTVDENGGFKIKFTSAGTYIVEVSGKAEYSGNTYSGPTTFAAATVVPSRCTVTVSSSTGGGGGGGGGSTTTGNISVKFRLIGSTLSESGVDLANGVDDAKYVTWIATKSYTLAKGSTTLDLFEKALEEAGLSYEVQSSGWLNYVVAPSSLGGHKLANMTNGDRSGWMYTLNGVHEQATLGNTTLQSGDIFIVHYVNDYLYEDSQWATGCLGTSAQQDRWLKAEDTNPKGSSSSGGSDGASSNVTVDIAPVVNTNDKGEAKVSLSSSEVKVVIAEAKENAADVVAVEPKINGNPDVVSVTMPSGVAVAVAKEADASLAIKTGLADITLAKDDLKKLGSTGNLVVTAEKTADGAVAISISAGGAAAKLNSSTVVLPKAEATACDVPILVKADGTEEVIKKSVVTENGVCLQIAGDCTVKIVTVESDFADTNAHWGKVAADFVAARGIFNGTGEKTFAPNDKMNRAMLATVLWRLENAPAVTAAPKFNDKVFDWATEGVAWAYDNEIINGDEQGNFGGADSVTREQLAAMLYRYAKLQGDVTVAASLDSFADSDQVADWAKDAMKWAVGSGLIKGNEDNTINPTGSATRAEVATVIMRLVENLV